jgi:hypothetical protein
MDMPVTPGSSLGFLGWSHRPTLLFSSHFVLTRAHLGTTFRSVTYPQIGPGQARLTWSSFSDELSKKKVYLVYMSILSILLSTGPGYHTLTPLEERRPRRSTPVQELLLLVTSMYPVPTHVPRQVTCPHTWPAHARVTSRIGSDTKCNTPTTPWTCLLSLAAL